MVLAFNRRRRRHRSYRRNCRRNPVSMAFNGVTEGFGVAALGHTAGLVGGALVNNLATQRVAGLFNSVGFLSGLGLGNMASPMSYITGLLTAGGLTAVLGMLSPRAGVYALAGGVIDVASRIVNRYVKPQVQSIVAKVLPGARLGDYLTPRNYTGARKLNEYLTPTQYAGARPLSGMGDYLQTKQAFNMLSGDDLDGLGAEEEELFG